MARTTKTGGGGVKAALSPAQRRALRRRQLDAFDLPAVFGPGNTLAALRRRGIIAGRQPHARLTKLGERVSRMLDKEKIDG